LTLLSSLLIASNTVCGIDEVLGGLRVPFAAVALGSFSVAVDVFVAAGFFAVVFAVAFFVTGFFVVFAMIIFSLKFFLAEQLSAFLHSVYLYFYADDAIKRVHGYYAHEGIGYDSGCV
jgi:hypothetical protein